MIQDIFPKQFHLDYALHSPQPKDTILLFRGNQVYLTPKETYPTLHDLVSAGLTAEYQFLFSIDTQRFFLAILPSGEEELLLNRLCSSGVLAAYATRHIRSLRPMHLAFAGYTAWHLFSWYQNTQFCGFCGHPMIPGTNERKMVCSHCGREVFPRINPCIIVAVHDGDRLLMTKYANRSVTWFVLIAGFIEIGETVEDTIRREVMEETGVNVKNIRYFDSQPWGVPGNLTLGFTAELDGSDEITLDSNELSEARWFLREEVPVPDDEVSITAAMIRAFVHHEF